MSPRASKWEGAGKGSRTGFREELLSRLSDFVRSLFRERTAGLSDQQLNEMVSEAERAAPGTRWVLFNRLGDACWKAGDKPRALRYFGKAIDALLEDDQPEPAGAVAKKVIRLHPEAVRTLCTLTWLNLASLKMSAAIRNLRDYARASKQARRENLACGQILEMGRLVSHQSFLEEVVKALDGLGCAGDSAEVRLWAEAGASPHAPQDQQEFYVSCLKAAIGSNVRLKTKGSLS